MKEKGKFYNLQEIRESIGIPVNYLNYQGIIDSIKSYLLRVNIRLKQKIESPFIPSHIQIFMQQKSGAQAIYNILNKNEEKPTGQKTWNEKFHFKDQEWKKNYIYPFNIIKYPAIQWFQTSINHNILVTNHLLVKMKLTNDSYCYYCHSQDETITHLFWTCDKIQLFLNELLQWLKKEKIYNVR